ncbi:hypothetical protein [Streptosporangium sp. NPDC002721]|uniref:hypothetical protein n=1 Tax=Streptosporangium sp. NPDC002721 TaxID=3366188 RepID=UPI0036CCE99F
MATIKMPPTSVLPAGPHRRFVEEIFQMYRLARRPPLREIVKRAQEMDLPGSASAETVRRTLSGEGIPKKWETAYAVYAPLCAMAGVDLDAKYYENDEDHRYDKGPAELTHMELLNQLWNAAIDGADDLPPPTLRSKVPPPRNDPWTAADYANEPAF